MQKLKKLKYDLADKLKPRNFKNILDLGCGSGKLSAYLSGKDTKITAIDTKFNSQETLQSLGKRFSFIKGDFSQIKLDTKFDLIIISLSIHQIPKQIATELLHNLENILNPDGIIFFLGLSQADKCAKKRPNYGYFNQREVESIFKKYKIIEKDSFTTAQETHEGGTAPHIHHCLFYILKKTFTSS